VMFDERQREALMGLVHRWRAEARAVIKTGHECAVHTASALQSAATRLETLTHQREITLEDEPGDVPPSS
jgi:hypothetical protein